MNYYIYLKIANIVCLLETSRKDWKDFLIKKYSSFLTEKKRADCKIKLIFIKKNQKSIKFIDRFSVAVRLYDNKRYFKSGFNFIFKFVLGNFLLDHNGFLLHASAIYHNKSVYLFSGRDRMGKSTISKLLVNKELLADDRSIIVKKINKFYFFSSPFYEKNPFAIKKQALPIKAVFFLHKASYDDLILLNKKDSFIGLLKNTMVQRGRSGDDASSFQELLKTLNTFTQQTRCYNLYFRKNKAFWVLIKDL